MNLLASFAIPGILLLVSLLIFTSKKELFAEFSAGCSDGMRTTVQILPTLLLLMVAVRMFSASGALAALCHALEPVCRLVGLPSEMLPVVLMRPLSGSGATAMLTQLFSSGSPDSFAGRAASVLMGSSDTILYTVSMYFSHTKTKKTGYALPVSFIVMLFCVALSCAVTRLYFGQ